MVSIILLVLRIFHGLSIFVNNLTATIDFTLQSPHSTLYEAPAPLCYTVFFDFILRFLKILLTLLHSLYPFVMI
jgi:hypothetical protein